MLKKDFISRIVDDLFKFLEKLIEVDVNQEKEDFLVQFQEMLYTFFKISDADLDQLLTENEERDVFLFDTKTKNKNIITFQKAAKIYFQDGDQSKAKQSYLIAKRIFEKPSSIFQFPTQEDQIIQQNFDELSQMIKL